MSVLIQSSKVFFEGKPIGLVSETGVSVIDTSIPDGSITAEKLSSSIEPIFKVSTGPLPTAKITSAIFYDNKIYHWNGASYSAALSNGNLSEATIQTPSGSTLSLSDLAANSLAPSLNYVGEFSSAPTESSLGTNWKQNIIYKNSLDGYSYVLTGTPLNWVIYLSDGKSFTLNIESTNGTIFKPGQNTSTLLKARLFKNGAEVTDDTPALWFSWRRVSMIPRPVPYDDATWNTSYQSGYKQVIVNVDDVYAKATFFCDIISS